VASRKQFVAAVSYAAGTPFIEPAMARLGWPATRAAITVRAAGDTARYRQRSLDWAEPEPCRCLGSPEQPFSRTEEIDSAPLGAALDGLCQNRHQLGARKSRSSTGDTATEVPSPPPTLSEGSFEAKRRGRPQAFDMAGNSNRHGCPTCRALHHRSVRAGQSDVYGGPKDSERGLL
jgi:hypothetical protein